MNKNIKVRVMIVDRPHHRSGRIHPREIVEKAIDKAQITIKEKRFFVGKDPNSWEQTRISLMDIIGIVTDLYFEGDYVVAKIHFLNTPSFKEFSDAMDCFPYLNMDDMFTMVALGSIEESSDEDEPDKIKDDYELLGIAPTSLGPDFGGLEGRHGDDEICV